MAASITPMSVRTTAIEGLLLITMKQVADERGVVREFYRASAWAEHRLPDLGPWLQVNVTESGYGALRGLHGEATVKLVAVAAGQAFGAYVDARPASPTAGAVVTVTLEPGEQVLVPAGVGNGFQTTSEQGSQYLYAFDHEWMPGMAGIAVHPFDPALAIPWPIAIADGDVTRLSAKDAAQPALADAQPRH